MNKEFLTEENYNRGKRKISFISLTVLCCGLLVGGVLVAIGVMRNIEISKRYSSENIARVEKQIEDEKAKLEARRKELADKGVKYDYSANYTDGDAYEYKIIYNVLDPSFDRCHMDEYKDSKVTKKYCSLKEELDEISDDFNKEFESFDSIPFFMFGGFIIFASLIISFTTYITTKRREMMAFSMQQVMPVAQEGMEKMEPTLSKVGSRMMKNMAPAYGEMAKEISKGIKEGLAEANKDNDEK